MNIIYFDFMKAFDMVPHDILLRKHPCYGIMGSMLAWTQTYLAKRLFHDKVAGEISKQFEDISGVPQEYYFLSCLSVILKKALIQIC